jgi:6-phosphofructokinase
MKPIRTIGIVNGGGDAPGLNPVIRAIVRAAINEHNMRVIGIRNGFDGLIWPEGAKEMTEETVSGILPRGGTILGTTNRGILSLTKPKKMARKSSMTIPRSAWTMRADSASTP